jgi:hypothetical protein
LAGLAESPRNWTEWPAALVYCGSVVSEIDEAVDLDGHRSRVLGDVFLGDALRIWALIYPAQRWASIATTVICIQYGLIDCRLAPNIGLEGLQ